MSDRVETERYCLFCGCTDTRACTDRAGRACHWLYAGLDVCTSCADEFYRFVRQWEHVRSEVDAELEKLRAAIAKGWRPR